MDGDTTNDIHRRYALLFGDEPIRQDAISQAESYLGVILPDDVKSIARFYGGGIVGGISHYAFDPSGPADSIVSETIRLRSSINLPSRFAVLAEPSESIIVLDIASEMVVWCDNYDISRINNVDGMLGKPDVWLSYSKFFGYLLDTEEEERSLQ